MAGRVRVYDWGGGTWAQRGADLDGAAARDESGRSVSLSADGTVVAIGTESNRARAYYRISSDWFPRGGEVVGGVGEDLGTNVALSGSGNTLAVTLSYDGGIRTFQWGGEWRAPSGPDIRGESAVIDEVRVALSSDGTRLLASTPSSYYKDGTGRVRLYEKGPVAEDWQFEGPFVQGWYQISPDLQGEPQEFAGQAIALSGDGKTVVIGSRDYDGDSENESDNRGRVLVYRLQPR